MSLEEEALRAETHGRSGKRGEDGLLCFWGHGQVCQRKREVKNYLGDLNGSREGLGSLLRMGVRCLAHDPISS